MGIVTVAACFNKHQDLTLLNTAQTYTERQALELRILKPLLSGERH